MPSTMGSHVSVAVYRTRNVPITTASVKPSGLSDALPNVGGDTHDLWAAPLRDFIADIRGEPHGPYPTVRDGWRYQIAIDAIRAGIGWEQLPT
jgi:hypothetical protein